MSDGYQRVDGPLRVGPFVPPAGVVYGPTDRSYWVIEGRFAAGAYPSQLGYAGSGQIPKRLKQLLNTGIDLFVNLTQDYPGGTDGHLSHYDPGVEGRAKVVRYRVPDEHLPACPLEGHQAREAASRMYRREEDRPHCPNDQSRVQTKKILDTIDSGLDEGQNVYLHCWGGLRPYRDRGRMLASTPRLRSCRQGAGSTPGASAR